MSQLGLTRNKDSVILRSKIDERNKHPLQISAPFEIEFPLALENLKSGPCVDLRIYGISFLTTLYEIFPISFCVFFTSYFSGLLYMYFKALFYKF